MTCSIALLALSFASHAIAADAANPQQAEPATEAPSAAALWSAAAHAEPAPNADLIAVAEEGKESAEGKLETFSERYASQQRARKYVRHGVRMGYVYANNAEDSGYLQSGDLFALGYEAEIEIHGSEDIDFVIVPNILALGINQGVFIPSTNLIMGLSFRDFIEVGAGMNVTPSPSGDSPLHMIVAAAVTPTVGQLQIPVALSYVPDVDGDWRIGVTTGVNWP